jgi:dihydrofolate synthase/folylpolyglutamate synthase
MPIATYEEALAFWHGRVNYEQRGMPADLRELKLDRMRELLERLGNPHEHLQVVHIAGSKGKGSTAAMLASILQRAGYRTGLFTSPHLCRVEERVQVNGEPIAATTLTRLMGEIEPAVLALEATGSPPTFFEIVTALGFLHFAREQVDWAIIEVGLGGRFDSTNVCTPRLCVITSISFDHTQQLGPTLVDIAREKAGIIKPGVIVIHGVEDPGARMVVEEASLRLDNPVRGLGIDFFCDYEPGRIDAEATRMPRVTVSTARRVWPAFELGLLGPHQARNAAVAVASIGALQQQGVLIGDEAVAGGLRDVHWPARMEVVNRLPMVILDCAHNTASVQALADTMLSTFPPARRTLLFAASGDKDLRGMLGLLTPHFERAVFTRYTASQRGADAAGLARLWHEVGGGLAEVTATPADAWKLVSTTTGIEEMIVITGSVFLAGELRPRLPRESIPASSLPTNQLY